MLLSFFCFYTNSAIAQETHFGVKAGFNYSSIVGDLTQGLKYRFSGHTGIFLKIAYSDKFSFQPELLYSSQGFQFSTDLQAIQNGGNTVDQNDFRTNVQFNFLTVPFLAKFALKDRLSLDFGPQVGFLLNQVTKIKNLDGVGEATNRSSVSGDFRIDYGAVVGLGIMVTDQFSISPRVYFGLRNRLIGVAENLQNYNVAIQLSANYRL